MSKPESITIDDVRYVRADSVTQQASYLNGLPYVICRTYSEACLLDIWNQGMVKKLYYEMRAAYGIGKALHRSASWLKKDQASRLRANSLRRFRGLN